MNNTVPRILHIKSSSSIDRRVLKLEHSVAAPILTKLLTAGLRGGVMLFTRAPDLLGEIHISFFVEMSELLWIFKLQLDCTFSVTLPS